MSRIALGTMLDTAGVVTTIVTFICGPKFSSSVGSPVSLGIDLNTIGDPTAVNLRRMKAQT